jgi:outer membrane protein assembly factor BamE (lipoprotein component of BamABCDE complex)
MKKFTLLLLPFVAFGCQMPTAQEHAADVADAESRELTAGIVQREIRLGMSGAEVASVLGSPNLVTTDEERREVWVYDRVSSSEVYSKSSAYGTLILIGGSSDTGARSTTQKSFTVIIKFDKEGLVRDFAYHTSKF